jgi:hypothetical protein
MSREFRIGGIEIRGGAGEFEAALIAVVLDRITEEERVTRQRPKDGSRPLPSWVLAGRPEEPNMPRDIVRPA